MSDQPNYDVVMTLAEIARFTRESEETLREWHDLGLIGRDSDSYDADDIEKVHLIQACIKRGLTAADVRTANLGPFNLDWRVEGSARPQVPAGTLEEIAESMNADVELLRRLWRAAGLSDQGEMAYRADAAMLRGSLAALGMGYPEQALIENYRILHETLGRAAESMQRTTHVHQLEVPLAQGASLEETHTRANESMSELRRMVEGTVLYFLRKAMLRASRDDFVDHVAIESGHGSYSEVPGRVRRAIAFIDLSDFTPLTATRSDVEGAELLAHFREIVHPEVMKVGGSVVKQIGDEFMLAFHGAREAVECLTALHRAAGAEPQFPAVRSGIHCGDMLYRDGDYVGTVPNAAARIRGVAGRHQVMVSGEVRREAGKVEGVEFVRVGRRALKGLPEELEVFEAVISGGADEKRAVDPVCGIEMAPSEVAARLTLDGVEREFCSDECLRRFITR